MGLGLIEKGKLAIAANRLIDAVGALKIPQGPLATPIGSLSLTALAWFTASGDLFPKAWQPYVLVIVAVLTGIHNLSALAKPVGSGPWSISEKWAVMRQGLAIIAQTANAFLPVVPPEWKEYLTAAIQLVQTQTTLTALGAERKP